jgi:purine nucleosidase
MGGATAAPGNITPLAEANIWHDPEAAALVLGAPWRVTLVPLDVTDTVLLGEPELARLERDDGPVGRLCWKILQHYLDFHLSTVGRRICPLHDPLAAILLTHPGLAGYEQATVTVECGGTSRGATIVDRRPGASRGGNVAVARQARRQAAVDRLMTALTQPGG